MIKNCAISFEDIQLNDNQILQASILQIYDTKGQLLLKQILDKNNTEIDISSFRQGIYLAILQLSDGSFSQSKLVVIK